MEEKERDIIFWAKKWQIPGYDWEDLAQELRIKLWLTEGKYDKSKASLRRFRVVIMRNYLLNKMRDVKRSKDILNKYPKQFVEDFGEKGGNT